MLSKTSLGCLILALICTSALAGPMLGGLNDEKPVDEEVKKVVENVFDSVKVMSKQDYQTIEPVAYRKQIVAGANYFIKAIATTSSGVKSHIHMRVYKPFRGPLELSALRLDQDENKRLEYFS